MTETISYKQREAIRGSFASLHDDADGNLKNARFNLRMATKAQTSTERLKEVAQGMTQLAFCEGAKDAIDKAVLLSRRLHEEVVTDLLPAFDEMYAHRLSVGIDTDVARGVEEIMMGVHRLNGYGSAYRDLRAALVEALAPAQGS